MYLNLALMPMDGSFLKELVNKRCESMFAPRTKRGSVKFPFVWKYIVPTPMKGVVLKNLES